MIWTILVVELIFEVLLRPSDYWQLIRSDRAYTPSTARYINHFYVFGEAIALITYIPEFRCITTNGASVCLHQSFGYFTQVRATAAAVLGPTRMESLAGRLFMGTIALRFFGVIRHWKQMMINQTYQPITREGIEKWIIPFDPVHDHEKRRRIRRKNKKDDDVSSPSYSYSSVYYSDFCS